MNYPLFGILVRTTFYALKFLIAEESSRTQVKKEWADGVLRFLDYELEISGEAPGPGSVILVGNHISYIDIPVILSVFPRAIFVAKDDLKKWPILGSCISLAGTVFISRKSGAYRLHAISQMISLLQTREDCGIVVFPSGTTSLNEKIPWKRGIFEIAKTTETAIQVFKIQYEPLRESAYIDDDNIVLHLQKLGEVKNKKIRFSWLELHREIGRPDDLAVKIRERVAADLSSHSNNVSCL